MWRINRISTKGGSSFTQLAFYNEPIFEISGTDTNSFIEVNVKEVISDTISELVDVDTGEVRQINSLELLENDIFGRVEISGTQFYFTVSDTQYEIAKALDYIDTIAFTDADMSVLRRVMWFGWRGTRLRAEHFDTIKGEPYCFNQGHSYIEIPYFLEILVGDNIVHRTILEVIENAFKDNDNRIFPLVGIVDDELYVWVDDSAWVADTNTDVSFYRFKILDMNVFTKLILKSGADGRLAEF